MLHPVLRFKPALERSWFCLESTRVVGPLTDAGKRPDQADSGIVPAVHSLLWGGGSRVFSGHD